MSVMVPPGAGGGLVRSPASSRGRPALEAVSRPHIQPWVGKSGARGSFVHIGLVIDHVTTIDQLCSILKYGRRGTEETTTRPYSNPGGFGYGREVCSSPECPDGWHHTTGSLVMVTQAAPLSGTRGCFQTSTGNETITSDCIRCMSARASSSRSSRSNLSR